MRSFFVMFKKVNKNNNLKLLILIKVLSHNTNIHSFLRIFTLLNNNTRK